MDLEFVADSEAEDQLRLSRSISPRRGLESVFSHDIANNPDDLRNRETGETSRTARTQQSLSASIISQFTSTVGSTGNNLFDSPIEQFSTAGTRTSAPKTKKPKKVSEIIDLSSDDDYDASLRKASSSRKKHSDPVESKSKPKPRKTRNKEPKAAVRSSSQGKSAIEQSTDGELASAEFFEQLSNGEELVNLEEPTEKKKKQTKPRKKAVKEAEASETQISPPPSKKRKSVDRDSVEPAKPTKRRKRSPPQQEEEEAEEKPKKVKATRKGKNKPAVVVDEDEESAPDELLLASEDETKVSKKSQKPKPKPPSRASTAPSTKEASPPRSTSLEAEPVQEPVQPPPPAPQPKVVSRPSLVQQNPHQIPKRGSISHLLKKTGAHAPLSSSKLTKTVATRIAPLHMDRKTPPPAPPPIPKPKKKVEEEEEDDFTGMTEKQIAKYLEEKKKKAWYSP